MPTEEDKKKAAQLKAELPGADVILQSSVNGERRSMVSDDSGSYGLDGLRPGVPYHITISAAGFDTWTSPAIMVSPGQVQFVPRSKLQIAGGTISVTVPFSSEQTAAGQVKIEERQRIFGIVPNFYVVYDHDAVPLASS